MTQRGSGYTVPPASLFVLNSLSNEGGGHCISFTFWSWTFILTICFLRSKAGCQTRSQPYRGQTFKNSSDWLTLCFAGSLDYTHTHTHRNKDRKWKSRAWVFAQTAYFSSDRRMVDDKKRDNVFHDAKQSDILWFHSSSDFLSSINKKGQSSQSPSAKGSQKDKLLWVHGTVGTYEKFKATLAGKYQ